MTEKKVEVLLVEEQEAHADHIRRAFKRHENGFGVVVAGSVGQAQKYLKESTPDLVITEMCLPDGKWTDLMKGEQERFPVVVMTSDGDENGPAEAMKAGALDSIVKSESSLADIPHIAERALREWGCVMKYERAQEALRETQEQYRSMMEAMNDLVYISSPEFRIEYINPAMRARTGYDASGEACYKTIHDLEEKCSWCVQDRVREGKRCETEVVSPKDGRPYHVVHSPIFHTDGSVSQMTICRDISDLKRAEEERLLNEKLQGVIEMAGAACHELNQPLMTISGYCELLMMFMKEEDPSYEKVKIIDEQIHRMGEITSKIMNIKRYETTEYLDQTIIDIERASVEA